jgi:hypothetical protein
VHHAGEVPPTMTTDLTANADDLLNSGGEIIAKIAVVLGLQTRECLGAWRPALPLKIAVMCSSQSPLKVSPNLLVQTTIAASLTSGKVSYSPTIAALSFGCSRQLG